VISVPYLMDTWGPMRSPASWYFAAKRVDSWPQDALRRLYGALAPDGRVRAIGIEAAEWGADDTLRLAPEHPVTEAEAIAHADAFSAEIGTLAFRHRATPLRPRRGQRCAGSAQGVKETEVTLVPDSSAVPASARLQIWHSLFHPRSPDGLDNDVLAELNAPILRSLLARFAESFGPLEETEGPRVTPDGIERQ
jgi:hypothetical protein